MARMPEVPAVCRAVVVAAYLAALAVAGEPGARAAWLGLALVAVWAAPSVAAVTGRAWRRRPARRVESSPSEGE
ncbi:hypothetical protein [Trujillonella humicola]|uniref:hypothetical protein n=1 Tax=Trujillonella humicola TaxID=3383699 RepID=UPI00390576E7